MLLSDLQEPANGTTLALWDGEHWAVVWRDDSAAPERHPEEHWRDDWNADPYRWEVVLEDVLQVFVIGELLAEASQPSVPSSPTAYGDEVPF